jgi:hypothetical protein
MDSLLYICQVKCNIISMEIHVSKPNLFTQSLTVFNHLLFFAVLLYTLLTSELFAFKTCSKNLIVANCILPLKGYLFNSAIDKQH